ncbi:hypothetical protein JW721_03325 [Candidatus Micrarchaeota archaeon]|nr:hypothetical protein [Candidatus Micrarchaeota archaeon]
MIVGNRITKVEASRDKPDPRKGLNFKINVKDAKITAKKVEIAYEYVAEYTEGVGIIRMDGVITAEEEKALLDKIKKEWTDNKRLPQEYAEVIINAINYFGSVNGVLASRIVNLSPPLVPPRFSLSKKE